MNNEKIYIAYGSNLSLSQMAFRCPTAKVIAKSEIKDYELLFRGSKTGSYATIEPCEGKSVPILLWTIGKSDQLALDRYEGYPIFYEKENMTIEVNGSNADAFVYVMTEGHQLGMPSQHYVNVIADGYKNAGFDISVLENALTETVQRMVEEQKLEEENLFEFVEMKL